VRFRFLVLVTFPAPRPPPALALALPALARRRRPPPVARAPPPALTPSPAPALRGRCRCRSAAPDALRALRGGEPRSPVFGLHVTYVLTCTTWGRAAGGAWRVAKSVAMCVCVLRASCFFFFLLLGVLLGYTWSSEKTWSSELLAQIIAHWPLERECEVRGSASYCEVRGLQGNRGRFSVHCAHPREVVFGV
jgi:hypothetical protein